MKWMIAAVAVLTAGPALAQESGWALLGTRQVNDRTEVDSFVLPGHRVVRQLRVCAQRDPVQVHDLDVYFENGGHQDIKVGQRLAEGSCTRDLDLEGGERDITRIDFRYEAAGAGRGRATVRVFARR